MTNNDFFVDVVKMKVVIHDDYPGTIIDLACAVNELLRGNTTYYARVVHLVHPMPFSPEREYRHIGELNEGFNSWAIMATRPKIADGWELVRLKDDPELKIWAVNDCDWYTAPTAKEAVEKAVEDQYEDLATALGEDFVRNPDNMEPLDEEALETLKFNDVDGETSGFPGTIYTYRFTKALLLYQCPEVRTGLFASTEY